MKTILLLTILTFSISKGHAYGAQCLILKGPSLYKKVSAMSKHDKVKHCTLSCQLANACGAYESFRIGVFKELLDIIGPGNAEMEDMKANIEGIRQAYSGQAKNLSECFDQCQIIYNY